VIVSPSSELEKHSIPIGITSLSNLHFHYISLFLYFYLLIEKISTYVTPITPRTNIFENNLFLQDIAKKRRIFFLYGWP
jgi:hypothetical protein